MIALIRHNQPIALAVIARKVRRHYRKADWVDELTGRRAVGSNAADECCVVQPVQYDTMVTCVGDSDEGGVC
jgi:hypothetical protein